MLALAAVLAMLGPGRAEQVPAAQPAAAPNGCISCHAGIEEMHPEAQLSCTDCHGGNASARTLEGAHVAAPRGAGADERVAALDEDLVWRRFQNPMDLRVARVVCGECHDKLVRHLALSLHGTTAGHLSDGFYEAGLRPRKGSTYGVFPAKAAQGGEIEELVQLPPLRPDAPFDRLASHYPDLPRKECMQCHLWSRGRALRGRVGFDGDYRGEGCAACHVLYALDGLSSSADRSAVHSEPGHPERHQLSAKPPTQTCTSCHYGDASIGLDFRGLSQLPPGAPGGPEIPGTTGQLLNRQFYLQDPALDPPDVHAERGMVCIDCHTLGDVMGDGELHGAMEQQVAISCSDCHGTFRERASLRTQRGTPLSNLRLEDGRVILTGKVDGREREVVQVVDVLDPASPHHAARALPAMTAAHEKLECYACHAAWNPNFIGFHFDRNESLSQLDLVSGERTRGRVTTQEKVFATWKSFFAGWNERGAIAPYLTGFSSMGSFTDERGERLLDQVLPRTAANLSGMTMIHHQPHTTRRGARSYVECHRTSSTWGMGSTNFQLARQLCCVADERGIEIVALNRQQLGASQPLAELVQPGVVALALRCDPLQGHAQELFAAESERGVHAIDLSDPLHPRRQCFVACVEPRALLLAGDWLYVADGAGGLRVYDASRPGKLELAGHVPTFDARALALSWPWLYVADGSGGLSIFDVRSPREPRLLSALATAEPGHASRIIGVQELFQYSRPRSRQGKDGVERPLDARSEARHLCALLDEQQGLVLADVTEPTRPRILYPDGKRKPRDETRVDEKLRYRGLVLQSQIDLAEAQGGKRTQERDYAYVLSERRVGNDSESRLAVWDVGDPLRPRPIANPRVAETSEGLVLGNFYNSPFLQRMFFVPGNQGVLVSDASLSTQPVSVGALAGLRRAHAIAIESFPLDKMLDEDGKPLKDVSHEPSRWLLRPEIERILSVGAAALGLAPDSTSTPGTANSQNLTVRLEFQRLDRDGSGFLAGDELAGHPALLARTGSGHVSLQEFARALGGDAPVAPVPESDTSPLSPREARVGRDGDLARLLDGIDPNRFDGNQDGLLERPDVERAFFAALDLSGDGTLDPAELSRHPGELREIRFGGERAARLFGACDTNHDGRVEAREFRLRDEEWLALDENFDGHVQLALARDSKAARRGRALSNPEWPARQVFRWPLPPTLTREGFAAAFVPDSEKRLGRKEMRSRQDVLADFDENNDGFLEEREWQGRVGLIGLYGTEVCADGFEERWDLDRDGKVTPAELPLPPYLLVRLGLRKP
jgi:Ca2+-binding EF-hand superfamily protein